MLPVHAESGRTMHFALTPFLLLVVDVAAAAAAADVAVVWLKMG
jgi:hypothetical protein